MEFLSFGFPALAMLRFREGNETERENNQKRAPTEWHGNPAVGKREIISMKKTRTPIECVHRSGWGVLFSSGSMAETSPRPIEDCTRREDSSDGKERLPPCLAHI